MYIILLSLLFGIALYVTITLFSQILQMFVTVFTNINSKSPFKVTIPPIDFIRVVIVWTLFYFISLLK